MKGSRDQGIKESRNQGTTLITLILNLSYEKQERARLVWRSMHSFFPSSIPFHKQVSIKSTRELIESKLNYLAIIGTNLYSWPLYYSYVPFPTNFKKQFFFRAVAVTSLPLFFVLLLLFPPLPLFSLPSFFFAPSLPPFSPCLPPPPYLPSPLPLASPLQSCPPAKPPILAQPSAHFCSMTSRNMTNMTS